jgi:hypothetical protein
MPPTFVSATFLLLSIVTGGPGDNGNPIFTATAAIQLKSGGYGSAAEALAHVAPLPKACRDRRGRNGCVTAVIGLNRPVRRIWIAGWTPVALSHCMAGPPEYLPASCDVAGVLRAPNLTLPPPVNVPVSELPPPPQRK